jgi:predicted transcriptional regulator
MAKLSDDKRVSVLMTFMIPEELKAKLEQMASDKDSSASREIRKAIEAAIAKWERRQ